MKKHLCLLGFLALLLIAILSCNPGSEAPTTEKYSLSSDTLALATQKMQEYVDSGKWAGIATLMMMDDEIVYNERFGFANIEEELPVEETTIFRIFSMTKPVTAVALMTLYEEGKFELDDKLSRYIPEFADVKVYDPEWKFLESQIDELTIRHLLTHSSGIIYGWGSSYVDSLYRAAGVGGWDSATIGDQVKLLATLPLKFQPGTAYEYGLSIDVAGYLIEVLSGVPLDEYFQTKIFDPLKMDDTGFYVPEEKHARLAVLYYRDKENKLAPALWGGDRFKKPAILFSGGGGLVSTMGDYLSFCRMLLNGGKLNGVKILEESTAKMIMSDQLPVLINYKEGMGYGLAGQVDLVTGEYSWAGAASTNFWIDPARETIIITFAQLMPGDYSYAYEFYDLVKRAQIKD